MIAPLSRINFVFRMLFICGVLAFAGSAVSQISVSPGSLSRSMPAGATAMDTVRITNSGASPVTYSAYVDYGPGGGGSQFQTEEATTANAQYAWVDIRNTGTEVPRLDDDAVSDPIPIGFDFSYFNNSYAALRISDNGFIGFGSGNGFGAYFNTAIPNTSTPNNAIYWCWKDMLADSNSKVHYQTTAEGLVIQFTNYTELRGGGTITAQVILRRGGEDIVIKYHTISSGFAQEQTIGIEDDDGSDGLLFSYYQPSMFNGKVVRFYKPNRMLALSPYTGTIAAGSYSDVEVFYRTAGLTLGTYNSTLKISHDASSPASPVSVPISVTITNQPYLVTSRTSIDFGTVYNSGSTSVPLVLTNGGLTQLNVTGITSSDGQVTVQPSSLNLAAGASATITVTYAPGAFPSSSSGQLTIQSNSGGGTQLHIPYQGSAGLAPTVSASPQAIEVQLDSGTSATVNLQLGNIGAGALEYSIRPQVSQKGEVGWKSLSDAGYYVVGMGTDAVNNKVYVTGGYGVRFARYTPATGTWEQLADQPSAANSSYKSDTSVIGDKVYVTMSYRNVLSIYDIATNSWTEQIAPLTDILISGTDGTDLYVMNQNEFYRYRCATGAWEPLTAPGVTKNYYDSLVGHNGRIYLCLTYGYATIAEYDIEAGTWFTEGPQADQWGGQGVSLLFHTGEGFL